jgi:hypothetical protein
MQYIVILALAIFVAAPATGGVLDDDYSIMKPEPTPPGVVKPYKSPRGTKQHVTIPRRAPDEPRRIPQMPPPLIDLQTGRALPNIPPPIPGSGAGGRETFQDRSARCVHQSGVYGQDAGSNYIPTCINQ